MTFRIATGEAATAVVFVLDVDHDRGSLPPIGILAIFLDRLNASLPTEGSDQGDVHDLPPAARHNKHGDTRGVWMPGHRVGVGDLNFAAVRHANVERLKRPLSLAFLSSSIFTSHRLLILRRSVLILFLQRQIGRRRECKRCRGSRLQQA
jgi:hypothetical protein